MESDKIRQPRAKRTVQAHPTTTSDDQPTHRTAAQASAEVAQIRRALADPGTATPDTLILMQQRYGNQAVQRLIQRKANPDATTVQRGLKTTFKSLINSVSSKIKSKNSKKNIVKSEDIVKPKKQAPNGVVVAIKSESDILPYFEKFCEKEYSIENLNFVREYYKFESASEETKHELAQQIYDKYIARGRKYSLNIADKLAEEVKSSLDNKPVDYEKFSKVNSQVELLLSDSYYLFRIGSQEFQEWQKK